MVDILLLPSFILKTISTPDTLQYQKISNNVVWLMIGNAAMYPTTLDMMLCSVPFSPFNKHPTVFVWLLLGWVKLTDGDGGGAGKESQCTENVGRYLVLISIVHRVHRVHGNSNPH